MHAAPLAGGAAQLGVGEREALRASIERELTSVKRHQSAFDAAAVHKVLLGKVQDWRETLRRHPEQAQSMIRKLLLGRLEFTPKRDEQGGYYGFRGVGTLLPLIARVVPHNLASPTGPGDFRRVSLALADYSGRRTSVMVAFAGLSYLTNWPRRQTRKNMPRSVRLLTTTATVPSGFRAAVAMKLSLEEVQAMRLAPGRMNRENCPNT